MKRLIILFSSLFFSSLLFANVMLPQVIRDSMVLQRDTEVKLWGWADAGEKITVRFNNKRFTTKADSKGTWQVLLPATKAGGPHNIDISANNSIHLQEVLFGDVWFCSGQSNMVHQMNIHDVTYAKDIAEANYPAIRQFLIPTATSLAEPQHDLPQGHWQAAVGEDVRPFSAVAYFFARKLYEKYHVPIGIINASVGGTPIEAWTSENGLKDFPAIAAAIDKNKDTAYINGLIRSASLSSIEVNQKDEGLLANPAWYAASYQPKGWPIINVPGYWEDQGIRDLNGVVWYRREIDVPAGMVDKPATVFLGRIVDADELYINGKKVGNTTYQYPQRRYKISPGILKAGRNIFVVRVTNNFGKGGFVPGKPYCVFAGKDTIDLKGNWYYKVGEVFAPREKMGNFVSPVNPIHQPAALYNGMVAPVTNYTIRGICWYQGETNTNKPAAYERLMKALINDWRHKWQHTSLPFIYVQLPGFMDYNYLPSESNWAELRESQRRALTNKQTAMVTAIDLGEWNDIHPDNKKDVGERMALAAMNLSYGENVVASGPLYQSATLSDGRVLISFSNIGDGLISRDGEALEEFAIAGADKKFIWANARIEGDKVVVWHDEVKDPKYVRYAWADNPVNPNLYNRNGLPASPFQTEELR